jgi:hypothetical protein
MAGVVELSGSVIESPQGLHSNAYKFPAKARLMICKVIGLPQTGQATSLLSTKSSVMRALCTRWRSATLTRINTSAKKGAARTSPVFALPALHASLAFRKIRGSDNAPNKRHIPAVGRYTRRTRY